MRQSSWPDAHPTTCVDHPKAFAGLIARGLDAFFDQNSVPEKYTIFERIGDIEISVDGEQFRKWELGKILRRVEGDGWRFAQYRTLKQRLFHARYKHWLQSRPEIGSRKRFG
jgi:hypothetical protein